MLWGDVKTLNLLTKVELKVILILLMEETLHLVSQCSLSQYLHGFLHPVIAGVRPSTVSCPTYLKITTGMGLRFHLDSFTGDHWDSYQPKQCTLLIVREIP